MNEVKACSKCILTSNDYPEIVFDANGVCDICLIYEDLYNRSVLEGERGREAINKMITTIKSEMQAKKYDCLIGVSGGVDSTYLAYLAKQWNLRALLVHVDNGWNTDIAVTNIHNLLQKTGFDLYTHVIDWEQMRNVQKAFIKANVLDIDLPFDNAFMAVLYSQAKKFGVRYLLTGHNVVTEGYLPPNFTHYKLDSLNIKAIFRKYGVGSLKGFPIIGPVKSLRYNKIDKIVNISPLNWLDYNKDSVIELIKSELDWRDYGGKHCENIYTRFYQNYILFHKFHVDKRKSHLQTLICSGQITRSNALEVINSSDPYESKEMEISDKAFFIKKMQLTEDEFEHYIKSSVVPHTNFTSWINVFSILRPIYRFIRGKKKV